MTHYLNYGFPEITFLYRYLGWWSIPVWAAIVFVVAFGREFIKRMTGGFSD